MINYIVTTLNKDATSTEGGNTSFLRTPSKMSLAAMGGDVISIQGSSTVFADFDKTKYNEGPFDPVLHNGSLMDPSAAMFKFYVEAEAGAFLFKGLGRILSYESAGVVEQAAVHGNSLASTRPTWGYKLFSEDGTFLKNGITSQSIPEARYTQKYMKDKYMDAVKFPNRREAYNWEAAQNKIQKGPLNKNNH